MSHFLYKAFDANGQAIKGITEGVDAPSVQNILAARGLYVIKVSKSSQFVKIIEDQLSAWRIQRKDVIEFSSNLALMMNAGVPLLVALDDLIASMGNEHMKATLLDIKRNIEMGVSFSDALHIHSNLFPDILIRLARVGEETGRLDKSLAEVSEHLQKLEDLTATVKRALIYPLFSFVTTGAAIIFWLAYVLPKIMQVIIGLGVQMPLLTKIVYEISKVSERFWYLLILIPLVIIAVLKAMQTKEKTKYYTDLAKIKCPLIKTLLYNKLLALCSEQLRLLIAAGVTIDRSFDITADVMGNEVFRRAILNAKREVTAGKKISEALAAQQVFPPLFIRMITIGEVSGNLDQQFDFLARHYYKIVDDASEKIGKMIEPLFMIVLGLMMGVMIAGVLLPMYDIFTKIGP